MCLSKLLSNFKDNSIIFILKPKVFLMVLVKALFSSNFTFHDDTFFMTPLEIIMQDIILKVSSMKISAYDSTV